MSYDQMIKLEENAVFSGALTLDDGKVVTSVFKWNHQSHLTTLLKDNFDQNLERGLSFHTHEISEFANVQLLNPGQKVSRSVICALKPQEIKEMGEEASIRGAKICELKDKIKELQNEIKEKKGELEALESLDKHLDNCINRRQIEKNMQCNVFCDYENEIAYEMHPISGYVLAQRPLNENERQPELPLEGEESAATEPEKCPEGTIGEAIGEVGLQEAEQDSVQPEGEPLAGSDDEVPPEEDPSEEVEGLAIL